ncbi:MAG: patatin-like phospholipase family protein [Candidatus Binatia bacterium]
MPIGVALSGGGAAALAHAGVLAELTAAGIPIQCVAGTSAGAVVGAAYAAGCLAAFRKTMCGLSRRRVLWLSDPTWPHAGLLEGRRALELIRPYIGERIEDLPHPFAAVATDLQSGAEVVLRHGSVLEAVRASVAIPGLFTPQRWQGRWLVDGGLVNPLPVDVARQLGAQFVIAVSVLGIPATAYLPRQERRGLALELLARLQARMTAGRAPPKPSGPPPLLPPLPSDEPGLIDVLTRASAVVQAHIAAHRLREHPPDYLLRVSLPEVGLFDFHRSAEAVAAGHAAARAALPEIQATLDACPPLRVRIARWLDGVRARRHGAPPPSVGGRSATVGPKRGPKDVPAP